MERADITSVAVSVNNHRWNPVSSFQEAGPSDTVYVLNPQTGDITFGDGVEGAQPPAGSTISVTYRYGDGSSGHITKRIDDGSDLTKFWIVVRDDCQALGWGEPMPTQDRPVSP
jgi:hypothetical protein